MIFGINISESITSWIHLEKSIKNKNTSILGEMYYTKYIKSIIQKVFTYSKYANIFTNIKLFFPYDTIIIGIYTSFFIKKLI